MKFGILKECSFVFVHIFPPVSSVKSVPMQAFKFDLQISKSHGPTKGGGGVPGLSSKGLLKVNIFFATFPY